MKSLASLCAVGSLAIVGGLCQCATSPNTSSSTAPDFGEIKGVVIVNNTSSDIDDIHLTVANTPRQVNVNRVLPMSEFATEFPAKRYEGNAVQLEWAQGGRIYSSKNITLSIPSESYQDQPVTVYLTITPGNQVTSQIK